MPATFSSKIADCVLCGRIPCDIDAQEGRKISTSSVFCFNSKQEQL